MAIIKVAASAALCALIVLCVTWELWLAPLRPGGSYIALKALPLVFALAGVFAGKRRTYQWSCMLVLFYMAEGVVRAWSERGTSQLLAVAEIALSLLFFVSAVAYARLSGNADRSAP